MKSGVESVGDLPIFHENALSVPYRFLSAALMSSGCKPSLHPDPSSLPITVHLSFLEMVAAIFFNLPYPDSCGRRLRQAYEVRIPKTRRLSNIFLSFYAENYWSSYFCFNKLFEKPSPSYVKKAPFT